MCGLFSRLGNTGTIRENKKSENQLFIDSPNLNYANISRYTVYTFIEYYMLEYTEHTLIRCTEHH